MFSVPVYNAKLFFWEQVNDGHLSVFNFFLAGSERWASFGGADALARLFKTGKYDSSRSSITSLSSSTSPELQDTIPRS